MRKARRHPVFVPGDGSIEEGADRHYVRSDFDITNWYPLPGGQGRPTAVCLRFHFDVDGRKGTGEVRMKSKAAVDELIERLRAHQNQVWGDG